MVEVKVEGLADLAKAMRQLPENIGRNVLRQATAAGAAVIRKEAVLRAPYYIPKSVMWGSGAGNVPKDHPPPGTLKRAIIQSQQRQLSSLVQQTFHVAVKSGKNAKDKKDRSLNAFYWRFVEFGTVKMSKRPFMRPAFEAKKQASVDAIRAYMQERLPKEFAKLGLTYKP